MYVVVWKVIFCFVFLQRNKFLEFYFWVFFFGGRIGGGLGRGGRKKKPPWESINKK